MKAHGFTLLELMIVVVIIGVLATTAVPLYHAYITEAATAEAKTTLADIASKEEAYYSSWGKYLSLPTNNTYPNNDNPGSKSVQKVNTQNAKTWAAVGIDGGDTDGGLWDGPVYFKYVVPDNTDTSSYTVCAHRRTQDGYQTLSLSNQNRRAYVEDHIDCKP